MNRGERRALRHYRLRGYRLLDANADRTDGLATLEQTLSAPMLHDCVEAMLRVKVEVYLPRFDLTWAADMRKRLVALGVARAFSGSQADFSGINGLTRPHPEALHLSAVCHKAFVEVNEEGAEAAAATEAVHMASRFPPPDPVVPVVRADHPFLFAIRDRRTGSILFWGRMVDPTEGA